MLMDRKSFLAGTAGLGAFVLSACGGQGASTPSATTAAATGSTTGKKFRVGILKFVEHPSLNQIENSLVARLDELSQKGDFAYECQRLNGGADGSVLNQMTQQLLDDQVDVIVPIATPAAQVVQAATEGKDVPVVFSAVSDPVGAKLVASMEAPGSHITGTSDALNTRAIMDLIFAAKPDTTKVGLLYSNSEDASKQPIAEAKEYLQGKGVEAIERTGTTTDEVNQAVEALIADGVQAVFTPTDNTIQAAELAFYEKLAAAKIPHYGGADSFALNGAFCGYGVDYRVLGKATADMVYDILRGVAQPATMQVETFENGIATVNTDTCSAIGFDLAQVKNAFLPLCTDFVEIKTGQEFEG